MPSPSFQSEHPGRLTRRDFLRLAGKGIVLASLPFGLAACARAMAEPSTPLAPVLPTSTGVPVNPTVVPDTPAAIPTAQPTLTHAEVLASQLSPLPGYKWTATKGDAGDQILLTDARNSPIAVYDERAGGVLRVALDAAAAFATGTSAADLLRANSSINIVQTPFYIDKDKQPKAASVILVTDKGESKIVPIPASANTFWDAKNKRAAAKFTNVVTQEETIFSYIDRDGNKDISPSFPKILVDTAEDERRVREALRAVAPLILNLPQFVDNFYSYPRAKEFKQLIETNYPGINFDDLLRAIKETSVSYQEDALRILAIGTKEKVVAENPKNPYILGTFTDMTAFVWSGRLNNSPIIIPTQNIRDPSELAVGLLKELVSLNVGQAITDNPKLYQLSIKRSLVNNQTYFLNVIERFGAYAFVQDYSSFGITRNRQNQQVNYAFSSDSALYVKVK